MSGLFPTSRLMLGIIEEIDTHHIRHSPDFYPSISSGITNLICSIKQKGLLHPVTVRPMKRYYEIVAGNRRYAACKALGFRKILCHIIELEDKDAFEISLIENIQRRTLSPIEEAYSFRVYVSDFGWGGISDLATKIGKSVSYVDKRLGLLNLPKEIVQKIIDSTISTTAAEELIPIHNKNRQIKISKVISDKRLSCIKIRKLIKNYEESLDKGVDQSIIPQEQIFDFEKIAIMSLDKSIIAIRIAMKRIAELIEKSEHNWLIYEILMQHRNRLHEQIDILIKEKKKINTSRSIRKII